MIPSPYDALPCSEIAKKKIHKGEYIFRQGDKTFGMFFITSGTIELCRFAEDGAVVIIHTARPNQTFAEASVFSESYHCDAIANETTELLIFKKSALLDLFSSDQDFAIKLTAHFSHQIQKSRRKVELLSIRQATKRVYLAIVEGLLKSDIKSFASEIGLSHEVVYRSLSELVKNGRLVKSGRGIYSLPKPN